MKDGAFGLSSMLAMPPGSLATTDDIVELCKVVAKHGGIYSSHIRNEGTGVFDAVKEAIAIGERAGVPVDIIHLKIADQKLLGPDERGRRADRSGPQARRERAGQRLSLHARQQQPGQHHSALGPRGRHGARCSNGSRTRTSARSMKKDITRRHPRLVQPLHGGRRRLEPDARQRPAARTRA